MGGADAVLENALHKHVLKPLKGPTEATLREFHAADRSWKELQENLQLVRERNPQEPGVLVSTPDFYLRTMFTQSKRGSRVSPCQT